MSWGNFILDKGFDLPAGGAVTKFRAVKMTGNSEEVSAVTANTDLIIGFVQFGVTTSEQARGKGASVRVMGVSEAEAVGAIAIGQQVTLEADGRVSALVAASGKRVVGRCVGSPSTNAGDRIALLVNVFGGVA
jgi:S-adenosylhomocysteine hydrolase